MKLGVFAAKAYTAIDTVAGVVNGGAALYDVYQNGDKMSGLEMGAKLAGAGLNLSSGIGAAAGKMFKRATPGESKSKGSANQRGHSKSKGSGLFGQIKGVRPL